MTSEKKKTASALLSNAAPRRKAINGSTLRIIKGIPEDGSVSEDDINGNDDFEAHVEEEEEKSELDSEQEQEEEYKIKWTNVRQPVAVVDFTQPSDQRNSSPLLKKKKNSLS